MLRQRRSQVNVADLKTGGPDPCGAIVVSIYYFKPPEFAVYKTDQRVLVQYADDISKANEQRKAIVSLAPLRGEINGLIDGWRSAPDSERVLFVFQRHSGRKLRSKAERYDRRVADALDVAVEGDVSSASALLGQIKQDILDERIARSRFEYLLMAFVAVLGVIVLAEIAMLLRRAFPCTSYANHFLCINEGIDLWRSFAGGAVGAFFSISTGIRGRTILPDLYRTSNLMDALLRVTVGAIGGVVLVSLVLAHFVQFRLGSATSLASSPLEIFIISFVAGFAERLVPDLLAKAGAALDGGGAAPRAQPPIAAPLPPAKPAPESAPGPVAPDGGADVEEPVEQPGDTASGPDAPASPDESTKDEELPAASGGVATGGQGT